MPLLPIKNDCCGCTACSQVCPKEAIQMKPDEEGFEYPDINVDKCVECQLCTNACPVNKYDSIASKEKNPIRIWGMINKDSIILSQSSSGGVFFDLAAMVIAQSGIVYGAAYNKEMKVVHRRIESYEGIEHLRGSKYVQSELGNIFKDVREDLRQGKKVLFSGTGCQVEGLKLFLRKDYSNLLTIDLVCHGVPSPKLFADYIHFLEKEYHSKVVSLNMRDKEKGWKQWFHYRVGFENGKSIFDTRKTNVWNKMFFSECISRPSCHVCRFTNYMRPSDVTLSDFWGVKDAYPDFFNENGVSLAIVNTTKGEDAINSIKDSYYSKEVSKEKSFQPCLGSPANVNPLREQYWKDVKRLTFKQLITKYHGYGFFTYYYRQLRIKFHLWRVNILKN